MKREVSDVLDEVRQLIDQYRKEIPGRRRAWPEAVKSRVDRLCELGLRPKEISRLTQISYFSILKWLSNSPHYQRWHRGSKNAEEGHFIPVQVQSAGKRVVTVAVKTSEVEPIVSKIATVTVTLPNGIKIEGVTAEFLSSWLGRGEASWAGN